MKTAVEKLEMKIVELEKDYAIPHKIYELCEEAKVEERNNIIKTGDDFVLYARWISGKHYFEDRFKQK